MKSKFQFNKLLLAMAATGGLLSNAALVQAAETQSAAEDIEIIEVSGFRGSLNRALLEKRGAINGKESIEAEDMGKFPDLNITESIQRVSGVAISREGGEGRQITLRGLDHHSHVQH